MIDTIAGVITSLTVGISLVGIFWIRRSTNNIKSVYGILAVIIFAFTLWDWYGHASNSISSINEIVQGIFLLAMTCINVYAAALNHASKVSTDRRSEDRRQNVIHISDERRRNDRRKMCQMKQIKLRTRQQ